MSEKPDNAPQHGQFLVYRTETGQDKIEVRLEGETAWLTQAHMAELFQTTVPNINIHLRNIFEEGELDENSTIKEFLIVRGEGKRDVERRVMYYNLDAIISVGYRIKSVIATRFRIWATQKLREYMVKGFVLDDERLKNPDQPFEQFRVKQIKQADQIGNDFDQAVKQLPPVPLKPKKKGRKK